jgi:UDP-N-acetylglucosamine 2-epimerase (hydrolysing)
VTTEPGRTGPDARALAEALLESGGNFVVLYPNDDRGWETIVAAYEPLGRSPRFRVLPTLPFEDFAVLLRNAELLVGNSSAGVREAPLFPVPSVNIGSRQSGRFHHGSILDVPPEKKAILQAIRAAKDLPPQTPSFHFGANGSAGRFLEVLRRPSVWEGTRQKGFTL